jgi:hypothetical protein
MVDVCENIYHIVARAMREGGVEKEWNKFAAGNERGGHVYLHGVRNEDVIIDR